MTVKTRTKKADYLLKLFQEAASAAEKSRRYKRDNEEYYYSNVDDNKTQFDDEQLDYIKAAYDIPISSKISFPIIEQFLAFLTGAKPFPRLIAPEEVTKETTMAYQNAYHGTCYESHFEREFANALRNMLVVGSGYLYVRPNNFFNETTFGIVQRHLDWKNVLVDPHSRLIDFSDADYMIIVDVMRVDKAEKFYGIKINDEFINDSSTIPSGDIFADYDFEYGFWDFGKSNTFDKKRKYIWIREFFRKEQINIYITPEGYVSVKKPVPIDIPNEEKLALRGQLNEITDRYIQLGQGQDESMQNINAINTGMEDMESPGMAQEAMLEENVQSENMNNEAAQLKEQMMQLQLQIASMPDELPGYQIEMENGETIESTEIKTIRKKRIKRELMIGDNIVEQEYLPTDIFPISHFCISHNGSPNKTFGILHYMHDLEEAMNKFISLIIRDLQTNSNRKLFYYRGTIIEQEHFESQWSRPGATIEIEPDANLPEAGMPKIIEPSPINQALTHMVDRFLSLIEYVTGMYGVLQGNSQQAPETLGATESMQNYGVQRVKLYSRTIEDPIQDFVYNTINYLQRYIPRDKYLKYFDENGDEAELQILDNREDLRFKVRVEIIKSLPTIRQMKSHLLGIVAGQTKNPYVADYLTQIMLKTLDLPEGDKLAADIDVIKNLEQQVQQLSESLKQKDSQLKSLTNNMQQKEMASKVNSEVNKAKTEIAVEKEKIKNENENEYNQNNLVEEEFSY